MRTSTVHACHQSLPLKLGTVSQFVEIIWADYRSLQITPYIQASLCLTFEITVYVYHWTMFSFIFKIPLVPSFFVGKFILTSDVLLYLYIESTCKALNNEFCGECISVC